VDRVHASDGNGARRVPTVGERAVLEQETRARLYDAIERVPGSSLSTLADELGIPPSTARYHGSVLVDAGLAETEKIRGKRRLFASTFDDEYRELAAALADEATARLLAAVATDGPVRVTRLADRLDRSPSTVSDHVGRHVDPGLVERHSTGNAVTVRASAVVESTLSDDGADADPPWEARAAGRAPADDRQ
jgi:predicted transcriptional regulator